MRAAGRIPTTTACRADTSRGGASILDWGAVQRARLIERGSSRMPFRQTRGREFLGDASDVWEKAESSPGDL